MANHLTVSVGQRSDKGLKSINQDFHDVCVPPEPQLSAKGVVIAMADGISTSDVSQIASQTAVNSFISDYFSTAESWSVKTSGLRVLTAINSWIYAQSQQSQHRFDKNKGYVCTFSALVVKSATAHIFHTGDTRIYRLQQNTLEQLTQDHRLWISEEKSYLSHALGIYTQPEIDYRTFAVEQGDIFIIATDGIYEYANAEVIAKHIHQYSHDLDLAAQTILEHALSLGSDDNLSIQIVRIDNLPEQNANEMVQHFVDLPFPPILEARMEFDGYRIVRELHASSRSHIYLAIDCETNEQVTIKAPSIDLREDAAYLERFFMEEWIAKRINNAHVLKPCLQTRKRHFAYIVTEFIEGQTLRQWMTDHPKPSISVVREIVGQIAKGLRAFHRLEMLHQDLRPENIMIDHLGTVKIIDFGSTQVAGIAEMMSPITLSPILGTPQYTAPEYFVGDAASSSSDLFSLGVITYEMLTGELPYGPLIARTKTKAAQQRLHYYSAREENREVPAWIDDAIEKAVHLKPQKRYAELSEFIVDLRQPNQAFLNKTRLPLLERNPVLFWKGVAFALLLINIAILSW